MKGKLTGDEKNQLVAEAERIREEWISKPLSQRPMVARPERFNFPIGLDDNGRPFANEHEEASDGGNTATSATQESPSG